MVFLTVILLCLSPVPCPPQNVSAVETCSSTSATLSWITSSGAVFYISVATHSNGTVHTCVSMATECEFQGLRCGETYDAYVLATNMQCNSSNSEHVTLRTGRCTNDTSVQDQNYIIVQNSAKIPQGAQNVLAKIILFKKNIRLYCNIKCYI